AAENAVGTVSGWIKEMAEAAKKAAEAAKDGGNDLIGKVVKKDAAGAGKTADAGSVNGIADGIKGIVEAAKKSGVDGLKDVQAVSEENNKDAGKLFTGKNNDGDAGAAKEAEKAAAAVSGVSGEQILKAIVDAAGGGGEKKAGKKAEEADNPIDAAIGTTKDDAAAFGKMTKDDQIAAAIVLRGMAKDGQFVLKEDGDGKGKGTVKSAAENAVGTVSGWIKEMAEAAKKAAEATKDGGSDLIGKVVKKEEAGGKTADTKSVNGIADGIKGIVEAAKKSGVDGLKDVQAVSEGEKNKDAGKLFTGKNDATGAAADAEKAAAAVSGVSGEQILKAIVEAAGDGGEKTGKKAEDAENPIDAAIGTKDEDAKAFGKGKMTKDDQIAAAIVLRGMAKDGQFVLDDDSAGKGKGTVKSAAENAVGTVSGWIKEMAEAAKKAAEAAKDGGSDLIGKVVKKDAADGKTADAGSVNGIADGIKGIVEAAKKSGVDGLKDVQAVKEEEKNKDAGKLFTGKNNAGGAGEAKEAEKAAAAVSGISGEQILKAIVEAAGDGGEKKTGVKAADAENPIDAAIGTTNDAAKAFGKGKMTKDDQIAAAIVLRGMAKDGQFVLDDDAEGKGKGTVKSAAENAVGTVSGWIKEMAEAAKKAAEAAKDGGNDLIGKVVKKD
ncbi:variable large family protein, partial [Borreliella burgdorferi]|uniref:variable large family protein n=1 Tax=Borreliella burgdorferi TaxID=139 RepID=UPI001E45F736